MKKKSLCKWILKQTIISFIIVSIICVFLISMLDFSAKLIFCLLAFSICYWIIMGTIAYACKDYYYLEQ